MKACDIPALAVGAQLSIPEMLDHMPVSLHITVFTTPFPPFLRGNPSPHILTDLLLWYYLLF